MDKAGGGISRAVLHDILFLAAAGAGALGHVYGIITQSGGTIRVATKSPGRGTSVEYLTCCSIGADQRRLEALAVACAGA